MEDIQVCHGSILRNEDSTDVTSMQNERHKELIVIGGKLQRSAQYAVSHDKSLKIVMVLRNCLKTIRAELSSDAELAPNEKTMRPGLMLFMCEINNGLNVKHLKSDVLSTLAAHVKTVDITMMEQMHMHSIFITVTHHKKSSCQHPRIMHGKRHELNWINAIYFVLFAIVAVMLKSSYGSALSCSALQQCRGNNRVNCGEAKQQCKLIRSQASQEWLEGSETRLWSPERTVKAHECAASHVDEEIVRYSLETRRVQDKEPVSQQMDAPYEHNAGSPYNFSEYDEKQGKQRWYIVKVAFEVGLETPADTCISNSAYSVENINNKATPWLQSGKYGKRDENDEPIQIWAGASIEDFIKLVHKACGKVYLEYGVDD